MNEDAEETTRPEPVEPKPEKPRGKCTGCAFEYQLGSARSGDYKGKLVVRKHNSRIGPGLCTGAQKPPRVEQTGNPMAAVDLGEGDATGPGAPQTVDAFTSPAPVPSTAPKPFYAGFSHEGSCGHDISEGDLIQSDGEGGYLCTDCIEEPEGIDPGCCDDASTPDVVAVAPGGVPVSAPQPYTFQSPVTPEEAGLPTAPDPFTAPDPWTSPAPASDIPEKTVTVSGQPDPDRDRWGRYLIHGQAHTRATTFAKLGANTKAIEAWNERNVIVGLTRRPDLLMLAEGKEVKRDKSDLNSIAQQAKDAAGSKIAANIGTAYHSFSERIDAGLATLGDVPERYRGRVQQYTDTVRAWGLTTRPEWIERTTAVRADQVSAPLPVAGTLDRIFQMPDGSLVIGDLKTGSDLSYGEMEIEVQLAVYAHGANTHGLFDWNTKTWHPVADYSEVHGGVREDIALVIHLPADGDDCQIYVADIARGWEDAQKLGQLQASLKTKNRFRLLTRQDLAPAQPAPSAPERCPDYLMVPDGTTARAELVEAQCDGPVGHGGVHHNQQYKSAWEIGSQPPAQPAPAPAEPSPVIAQAQQEWDHAVGLFSSAASQEQLAELYQYALDSERFTGQQLGTLAAIGQERLHALALRT